MKKYFLLLCIFFSFHLLAQNLYFDAYKNIQKAKRFVKSNPQKADMLFIEAYSYLKQLVNKSIDNEKPSANGLNLLGMMYLKGWGIEKNEQEAVKLLCAAKQLGNIKAKKTLEKLKTTCKPINFKELKQ
jgi:TPR repeat protein